MSLLHNTFYSLFTSMRSMHNILEFVNKNYGKRVISPKFPARQRKKIDVVKEQGQ